MAIHHVALRVRDCEVAMTFYKRLLRASVVRRVLDSRSGEKAATRAIWLDVGGAVLMLERALRGRGPSRGSGHVLVFAVSSLRMARRRIMAAGSEVIDETSATVYCQDPDGHRVGLSIFNFGPAKLSK